MSTDMRPLRSEYRMALLMGAVISLGWVAVTWRYTMDFADEGYYWYGAQRMLHGELPMRDYMAYDIGRYAWTAAVMRLLGDDGIFGARMGAALFQAISVAAGVMLAAWATSETIRQPAARLAFSLLVALLLNLWVHPYYKVFDYGTSIFIVAMLAMMLTSLDPRAWLGAGVILGLAAIVGRNHGVYGALSALLLIAFLALRRAPSLAKRVLAFIAGVFIGYSPTFAAGLFVAGFAQGLAASIIDLINSGTTNIALPVPWPWTVNWTELGWVTGAMHFAKGLGFVGLLVLPAAGLFAIARKPLTSFRPLDTTLLCASLAGISYAHYAFSRADLVHLTLAAVPAIFLVLCLGTRYFQPLPSALALLAGSIMALWSGSAALNIAGKNLTPIEVTGVSLHVSTGAVQRLRNIGAIFKALPQARNSFLIVPDAPGIHAIYRQRMPIWEIYALSKHSPDFEMAEIARLERAAPHAVLVSDHAVDGREDMRYSATHPLLYRWIKEHYQRQDIKQPNAKFAWEVYVHKMAKGYGNNSIPP